MIICIDVSQRTKDELEKLLAIGEYRDYSEAVSVAVGNQLLLHTHSEEPSSKMAAAAVAVRAPKDREPKTLRSKSEFTPSADDVPQIFAALDQAAKTPALAPFPNDLFAIGQVIPVDRWIFGQHNKLLPVKATCRALARLMLADSREGLRLAKAASDIASEAVKLGDYLRHVDAISETHRDEALSFAFPYTDSPNGDKSRLRYANHFVASFTKQGTLSGLPIELKLANRDHSRNSQLLLTAAGWQFALMVNPIMDSRKNGTQPRFSDEEVSFMIDHIRSHVPAEAFAFGVVLTAVTDGANTPDKLDNALEQYLPKRSDKPFTRAFLTTQRAGVISRMIDLALLQRLRDGINVTYEVTAKGSEYSPTLVPQAVR